MNFERVQHLFSPEDLVGKVVVEVGLGSGGAPVCDHLTMNGVGAWKLYDPDTLDEVNLVKHPRQRADLGRPKVEIQRDWIVDRNPNAVVETHREDVYNSSAFKTDVAQADLVLCCVDTRAVRAFVNAVAVEMGKPCITGSVFRQGVGGEIYAYLPGKSACFACMERVASTNGFDIDSSIEPSSEEREKIYGLNLADYRSSGLSLDIAAITTIHARMALDVLLDGRPLRPPPLRANWIIHYNRPLPYGGGEHLKTIKMNLRPQKDCLCAQGN